MDEWFNYCFLIVMMCAIFGLLVQASGLNTTGGVLGVSAGTAFDSLLRDQQQDYEDYQEFYDSETDSKVQESPPGASDDSSNLLWRIFGSIGSFVGETMTILNFIGKIYFTGSLVFFNLASVLGGEFGVFFVGIAWVILLIQIIAAFIVVKEFVFIIKGFIPV